MSDIKVVIKIKPLSMKSQNFFSKITVNLITLLILGNVWCYLENDRPLKLMTNLVVIFLLFCIFIKQRK